MKYLTIILSIIAITLLGFEDIHSSDIPKSNNDCVESSLPLSNINFLESRGKSLLNLYCNESILLTSVPMIPCDFYAEIFGFTYSLSVAYVPAGYCYIFEVKDSGSRARCALGGITANLRYTIVYNLMGMTTNIYSGGRDLSIPSNCCQ